MVLFAATVAFGKGLSVIDNKIEVVVEEPAK